jgi:hypothetical protein
MTKPAALMHPATCDLAVLWTIERWGGAFAA